MEKILYLDGSSGISGDMTVAALLDLGADQEILKKALDSLKTEGFSIQISRVKKAGLDVCDFSVILDEFHENHDHDMEYLHGQEDNDTHSYPERHSHGHIHHVHRGLQEILEILEKADLTERARETAVRIFTILAEAEAKAHGVPADQVHFHEVGAVDSIVDIVAAAVCLDDLDISQVIVPALWEGSGCIRCQHGVIPVPVPAVVNIVQKHQITLHPAGIQGELVTPTGAAIVAAIQTSSKLPKRYQICRTGMGAGKRSYETPGILRAMLIQSAEEEKKQEDQICRLETNLDDCSGEILGYVMERLFREGARDVHYFPIFMKKNRPAYQLNVICELSKISRMEQIIFEETTTIGVRRIMMERTILPRKEVQVNTKWGEARGKRCILPDGQIRLYPEYESVRKLAEEYGISCQTVHEAVKKALEEQNT